MPTIQLNPIDDAYVAQDHPTSKYGGGTVLVCTNYTSNRHRIDYLKFDISALKWNKILNAKLWLFQDNYNPWGTARGNVSAYKVSDIIWDESTITWNNRPALGDLIDTTNCASSNTWYSWNLKDYVEERVGAGADYISAALDRAFQLAWSQFKSKEYGGGSYAPYLEVEYAPFGEDLFAKFEVGQGYRDLKAEFELRQDITNLFANFTVRHSGSEDLKAVANIVQHIDLFSVFKVRHSVPSERMDVFGPYTAETSISNTSCYVWSFQRKVFHAAGRHWIVYCDALNLYHISRPDGSETWGSPQLIKAGTGNAGSKCATWVEGNELHYGYGSGTNGGPLLYRKGTLNPDGTISWAAAEQTIIAGQSGYTYYWPSICVDSEGYPWIAYSRMIGTAMTAWIRRSSTKDGTWTTAPNYPAALRSDDHSWMTILVPLTGGKVFAFYVYAGWYNFSGRICDADGIGSEIAKYMPGVDQAYYCSAVAVGDSVIATIPDQNNRFHLSKMEGGAWGDDQILETGVPNHSQLLLSKFGNSIFAIWPRTTGTHEFRYKKSEDGGASWSDWDVLFQEPTGIQTAGRSATAYSLGSALGIAWLGPDTIYLDLRYAYLTPTEAPELKATFHVGQDSADLKAVFRVTQEDLFAKFVVAHTGPPLELFGKAIIRHSGFEEIPAEFEVTHWADLKCTLRVRKILNFEGSLGIGFQWWGGGGWDQMVDFEMLTPTGSYVGKFPDGPAGFRWVLLSFKQLQERYYLMGEADIDGSRPDRSRVIGLLWTYHSAGLRRVDSLSVWRGYDLRASFIVRQFASEDLRAVFEVAHWEDLKAEFIVQHWKDLKAIMNMRHKNSANLKATFHVGQDSRDLKAEFTLT